MTAHITSTDDCIRHSSIELPKFTQKKMLSDVNFSWGMMRALWWAWRQMMMFHYIQRYHYSLGKQVLENRPKERQQHVKILHIDNWIHEPNRYLAALRALEIPLFASMNSIQQARAFWKATFRCDSLQIFLVIFHTQIWRTHIEWKMWRDSQAILKHPT